MKQSCAGNMICRQVKQRTARVKLHTFFFHLKFVKMKKFFTILSLKQPNSEERIFAVYKSGGYSRLPHHSIFRAKKGPTVSVSKIRGIILYECSEIIWTRNFTIFTKVCYNIWTIFDGFFFF